MEQITINLDRDLIGLATMIFLRIMESLSIVAKKKNGYILFETFKEFFRFG